MKLACNWSYALLELIEEGAADVDYIKGGVFGRFGQVYAQLKNMRPVLLHGLGMHERLGMPSVDMIDFTWADRIISGCGSPHYGVHLGATNEDIPDGMAEADILGRVVSNTMRFKNSLSVPLLLENTPDCPHERTELGLYPMADTGFISKVLLETDTLLLLDLAHAKVSAAYYGINPRDYIKDLPFERVREIHIIGTGVDKDGFTYDPHLPLADEDYSLLEWALAASRPHIVTLEYGADGDADKTVLKTQLDNLSKLIK